MQTNIQTNIQTSLFDAKSSKITTLSENDMVNVNGSDGVYYLLGMVAGYVTASVSLAFTERMNSSSGNTATVSIIR